MKTANVDHAVRSLDAASAILKAMSAHVVDDDVDPLTPGTLGGAMDGVVILLAGARAALRDDVA